MPARPARPSPLPVDGARDGRSSPRPTAWPPPSRADRWHARHWARVSTASSSSTSRSDRRRTTSSASSGGWPRPSGSGTAARWTRSRPACCRVFLGKATRVVEFHLADDKAYRATVCFGASSTTDDLEGELTPATGPRRPRETVEAALAGVHRADPQRPPAFSRDQGRRPPRLRHGPGRGDGRAGRARRSRSTPSTCVDWDDTDPDRPIAILDVRCSAGTYIRALARDLGGAAGQRRVPRRAAADRRRPVRRPTTPSRSTRSGPRPPDGPAGLLPLLRPIDDRAGPVPGRRPDRGGGRGRVAGPVRPTRGRVRRRPRSATDCRAPSGRPGRDRDRRRQRPPRPRQGPRVEPGADA